MIFDKRLRMKSLFSNSFHKSWFFLFFIALLFTILVSF